MNDSELKILRHSLGFGEDGSGTEYRNHFVTGPGSTDYADCCALVERGLMTRREGSFATGGDPVFFVTRAGQQEVSARQPSPDALTRSQRRYLEFLDADSGLRFGEWLRARESA